LVKVEDAIKRELPCISNAVLIGDKRKFITAFLTFKVNSRSQDFVLRDRKCTVWFIDLGKLNLLIISHTWYKPVKQIVEMSVQRLAKNST
jgi:hypothetical protein